MAIELNSLEAALERAVWLTRDRNERVIIGLIGKPGAGKSSLSKYLLKHLPKETTALVPMDGYHLSNAQLKTLGRADRKGAPDTFDVNGYVELLKRIKTSMDDEIYFPIFHREIEESIAAEGVVHPYTTLVLTEGNYLLVESDGWAGVADSLTESWFVDVDNDKRMARLVARHIKYGKSPEAAHAWANGTDQRNAELIETTRMKADVIFHLD
ncbi:MAG: nucleoside/nucleotide kinase family protein [Actinomycetes bacterium]